MEWFKVSVLIEKTVRERMNSRLSICLNLKKGRLFIKIRIKYTRAAIKVIRKIPLFWKKSVFLPRLSPDKNIIRVETGIRIKPALNNLLKLLLSEFFIMKYVYVVYQNDGNVYLLFVRFLRLLI